MSTHTVQRSYVFRIYPTASQEALCARCFDAARWVWNAALAWQTAAYWLDAESVRAHEPDVLGMRLVPGRHAVEGAELEVSRLPHGP